jgi:hypothetical protein
LTLAACNPPEPVPAPSDPWFIDRSEALGLDFVHVRADKIRYYLPEIMSGGAGWIDYDGDGFLDLYLVQGGAFDPGAASKPGNRLYRNREGLAFEEVTDEAGVGDTGYGMGVAVADYDNDGDDDLYITNVGPNVLYQNNGDGRFFDVTERAGVGHPGWGSSAAFVDYDGDGLLDLYAVNYIDWSPAQELECSSGGAGRDYCHPDNYHAPATDALYINLGDGTFRETTHEAGIDRAAANGLGIVVGDFNTDDRIDFYIANDGNPNNLWINNGDGTFTDRAVMMGSAVNRQGRAEAGMGATAFDVDDDGDLDLFLTHLRDETNTLYLNESGSFQDITATAGLAAPSIAFTGFGASAADFDHDGLQDLFIANGRVGRAGASDAENPFAEPNQLFRGTSPGSFEEVLPRGGLAQPQIETSRAAAFADYDNDGDTDIAVVNNGGPVRLLQNVATKKGDWIGFRFDPVSHHATTIGTKLTVFAAGRRFSRVFHRDGSYLASNDPRLQIGLGGSATVDSASITWPNGARLSLKALETATYHTLPY